MITEEELLLLPKGSEYPIQWDKSEIVEVLKRRRFKGVWGFLVINLISKKVYSLPRRKKHNFTILKRSEYIRLGQLLPK